jgi:dTMP kinase
MSTIDDKMKTLAFGTFIVFEGGDACGKTTQVEMLMEKLTLLGLLATKTSFPRYGEATGRAISRHLRGETWVTTGYGLYDGDTINVLRAPEDALFFQALQTLDKYEEAATILSNLRSGHTVVSSRWYQSAEIYGADDGLDARMLNRAHACLPRADVNILLHLSSEASLNLRPDMRDRFERDRAKQDRIRQRYLDMWNDKAKSSFVDGCGHNWPVVYCEGKSSAEVHDEVWDLVLRAPGFATRAAAALNKLRGTP